MQPSREGSVYIKNGQEVSALSIDEIVRMVRPTELPSTEEHERREGLIHVLGDPVCRRLGIYRIPEDLVLSVVIPVFNERHTIHEILRQVRAVPVTKQIILVDDCSEDGTREILRQM